MNKQFFNFLLDNGYKEYPSVKYIKGEKESKLFCKKVDTKFECSCNEKPVQICVEYTKFLLPTDNTLSNSNELECLNINITACNNENHWFSLKCYGMSLDNLINDLKQIENKLIKAWEAVNEEAN